MAKLETAELDFETQFVMALRTRLHDARADRGKDASIAAESTLTATLADSLCRGVKVMQDHHS